MRIVEVAINLCLPLLVEVAPHNIGSLSTSFTSVMLVVRDQLLDVVGLGKVVSIRELVVHFDTFANTFLINYYKISPFFMQSMISSTTQ